MSSNVNEIILLLGAGASVEAGIPDSTEMVQEIENLVSSENSDWNCFRDLYRYILKLNFLRGGIGGKIRQ